MNREEERLLRTYYGELPGRIADRVCDALQAPAMPRVLAAIVGEYAAVAFWRCCGNFADPEAPEIPGFGRVHMCVRQWCRVHVLLPEAGRTPTGDLWRTQVEYDQFFEDSLAGFTSKFGDRMLFSLYPLQRTPSVRFLYNGRALNSDTALREAFYDPAQPDPPVIEVAYDDDDATAEPAPT